MSTKIYNGYTLPKMSAYQLRQFIIKLRGKLYPLAIKLMKTEIAEQCTDNIDDVITKRIEKSHYLNRFKGFYLNRHSNDELSESGEKYILENYIYSNVENTVEYKFKEIYKTHGRNPSVDFQFSISFAPEKDKTFVLIYTEQKEYERVFEKMKGVKKYPYFDNTDSPKGISHSDWKKRGKEWDNALKDSAPCNYGLEWTLLNTSYPPFYTIEMKDVIQCIPNIDYRSKRLAEEKVMNIKMKEYRDKSGITPEKLKTLSFSESGYFDARDYCSTEDGKKQLKELTEHYSKTLPIITEEILKMNYTQLNELEK